MAFAQLLGQDRQLGHALDVRHLDRVDLIGITEGRNISRDQLAPALCAERASVELIFLCASVCKIDSSG